MDASNNCIAMCSIHADTVALAVCFDTKELLCFQCSMDKAHTMGVGNVKQIEQLSEESEKLSLTCILAKQKATMKQKLIDEYKEKAKSVKEDLKSQVGELFDQLSEKIGAMRDNTIGSLENEYDLFLNACKKDNNELSALTKTIDDNLHKLSVEKDISKAEIEKVMIKLDDIRDYDFIPNGTFVPKIDLREVISKCDNKLGELKIFNTDDYEMPISVQNEAESPTVCLRGKPPKSPPIPKRRVYGSSISVSSTSEEYDEEKPKIIPRVKLSTDHMRPASEDIKLPTKSRECPEKGDDIKSPKSEVNDTLKEGKRRRWFPFSKDKKPGKLEDYECVTFVDDKRHQARYMINTTMTLSELPPTKSKTPFRFSKLIPIGPRRFGLLCKEHSNIFITGLNGKVQDSKSYAPNQLKSVVDMTDDMIAVLKNRETEIEILQVRDDKLDVINTLKLKLDVSDFTGFDYSKTKSQFAIGTEDQYLILDKKGKVVKTRSMEATANASDIMTIFDFENSNIFIINKIKKSMKCLAFKGEAVVWKRKCEDPLFQPRSAILHQQQLCIASPRVVTIFAAKDGKPGIRHETSDLVKDCLGVGVIDDDVIVISTDSNNLEESKKLGFLSL